MFALVNARPLLCLLLGLGLLSGAPVRAASPDETTRARQLGQEGAEAFRKQNWAEALQLFQEANRLVPHPNLDVNIGRTYEAMGQPDQALLHCKIALNAPGVPEPTRKAAQQCVERVTAQLVRPILEVGSTPAGAEVRIDGKSVGRTPWRGDVEPGRRQIDLELTGYTPASRTVNVERGKEAPAVQVVLLPANVGGLLTVTSAPSGATVTLDKDVIGGTPIRAFQVDARSYVMEVRKPGYAPEISTITIEDGKLLERVVTLVPIGGETYSGPRPSWPGWAMIGAGVLALSFGGYYGLEAIDTRDQADQLARTSNVSTDEAKYDGLVDDMNGQRTASDVFMIGGSALVVGGATWLLWPQPAPPPKPAEDPETDPEDTALR